MKSSGPLRRVVKRENDKLSYDWDVELTLKCGHVVRRKWTRKKQRRARCHICWQFEREANRSPVMAIRERRECDVFGTTKDVTHVRVDVTNVFTDGSQVRYFTEEKDLCDRAERRLLKFIHRGLSKPDRSAKKEKAE